MPKIKLNFIFPLISLFIIVNALSRQMFMVPPLGKLLDPFIGAVQNGHNDRLNSRFLNITKQQLHDEVSIFFDDRKVPHIYARNQQDLYFAQGYITAYYRLWQMDFLSRVSGGRLSEIITDDKVLESDRKKRRTGILGAAEASLKYIERDTLTNRILTAYTSGVNAFIEELGDKDIPLEFKLMDYKPEPWSKLKSVLIMKYVAEMLTGHDEDLFLSKMMLSLGEERFSMLFPDYHPQVSPIVTGYKSSSKAEKITRPDYLNYSFLSSKRELTEDAYNPALGSNSWVVSGNKTKSGNPILANDPHLNLSFPSIWLEMQLSSAETNVYGVSIPGTPSVIVGFNENIAWGITNGADDVKDWYKLKISNDRKKYLLDGQWKDLKVKVEEIGRKNQASFYDTVYTSVHGPIPNDPNFNKSEPELTDYALKWGLHTPSNEFKAIIKLNQAKDYKQFLAALKDFKNPVQNFTFAGKDKTIAVIHQGNMAIKKSFQGKFLMDGTKSYAERFIPQDSLPQQLNPVAGYIVSANQHPTAAGFPYYVNGYYSDNRSNRINALLAKANDFDVVKMQQMQLDNINFFAHEAAPLLIHYMRNTKLSQEDKKRLDLFKSWDGSYTRASENAVFYELWWKYVKDLTWDELKEYTNAPTLPNDYILLDMISAHPDNVYFDKIETSKKENAENIITEAYTSAMKDFRQLQEFNVTRWGDHHNVLIKHLASISAFSIKDLSSDGHPQAINAIGSNWGPSWRMIVELGEKPVAYGILPGGESGNIGSPFYKTSVDDWHKGKYYRIQFYSAIEEAKKNTTTTWLLKKEH